MNRPVVFCEGAPYERGLQYGSSARFAIDRNVKNFWNQTLTRSSRACILQAVEKTKKSREVYSENTIDYIKGIAYGSGVKHDNLMAFNLFNHIVSPDECTVIIAMGSATSEENTLFLKNSDKVGSETLVGPKFHKNKEINVILSEKPDDGNRVIGVAAAGETGLKMGLNDKGVAAGTNICRTVELKERKVDLTRIRALDRAQLIREGLRMDSAAAAGKLVLQSLVDNPMATPGNMEFADHKEAVIIEGSYDRIAALKMTDGVAARSNRFVLLHELNDPEDFSSIARFIRANRLLHTNKGNITVEEMMKFSQDHENGPSLNSICRHHSDFRQETSLSSAIMEIDRESPENSKIHIALGKPCLAWPSPRGHVSLTINMRDEEVPLGFRDGSIWKEFYKE